eukprot:scaffold2799_cov408-Prasinococcus_capsulatus_cf.AAC.37
MPALEVKSWAPIAKHCATLRERELNLACSPSGRWALQSAPPDAVVGPALLRVGRIRMWVCA